MIGLALLAAAAGQLAIPTAPTLSTAPATAPAIACLDQAMAGGDTAPVDAALDAYLSEPTAERDRASQAAIAARLAAASGPLAACRTRFPGLAAHGGAVNSYLVGLVMNRAAANVATRRRFDPGVIRQIYRTLPPATAVALVHGPARDDAEAFERALAAAGQPHGRFGDRALPILLVATDRALLDQAAEIAAP